MSDGAVEREESRTRGQFSAERTKAYVDAVVAIAMTLLILPLMESVAEAAGKELSASEWLGEHWSQIISFVLSFFIIALFWIRHHQLFADVEAVSNTLLWITVLWMLTIVWIPVSTAMTGQLETGRVVEALYIGSMIATCLCMIVTRRYLRRHPELHEVEPESMRRGMLVDLSMGILYAVALVLAMIVPQVGYFGLFVLLFVRTLANVLERSPIAR
ncbi:DUF1211 domain-containing protein [Brachybacterium sp. MASK1Z-5]|uniref:DUF1211 domain-containing protein n=1 Tax=Brachybacterium halotolerans TaxID=2795215 RepID=A0ABS1B9N4_9MICO|nr:TMEM175 family protein [Brachybacterium halotolerans]MBK0331319.1 DUF1211 domain-containing protein [Brachybacterium halotolerans]